MKTVCRGQESAFQCRVISEFLAELGASRDNALRLVPLRGGLETCGVARASQGGMRAVVKRLRGHARREVAAYELLSKTPAATIIPRYLGRVATGPNETYLFLEWVPRRQVWPWGELSTSTSVLRRLALVHRLKALLPNWDYASDLDSSAIATLDYLAALVRSGNGPAGRPMLKTVERVVETLPAMRRALAQAHEPVLLHGDAHASNAVIRPGKLSRTVLLDWGRARMGSPLEDVSSWLQSLGFWEWEVRRRHDTLLRCYFAEREWDDRITPEFRRLYWFATASNALAGALRYHLAVSNDPDVSESDRYTSTKAARDWLRMIRRADLAWRN